MKYVGFACTIAACIVALIAPASAQLAMFHAQQGISDASLYAAQNFAPDSRLILIGAFGDTTLNTGSGPASLRFDLTTGRSNAWAYAFHSAQKNATAVYVVVDVQGIGKQVFDGFLPVDLPPGVESGLETTAPYFNSDKLIERLKTDATFTEYRASLPTKRPRLIGIRRLVAGDTDGLPAGFTVGSSMWFVGFAGGKDTAMECYVSAQTGETYCRRSSAVAGVRAMSDAASSRVVVQISAGDFARVSVRCDQRPEIILHSIDGAAIRSAAVLHSTGSGWTADLDLGDLPAGTYLCQVVADGWTETVPIGW